MHYQQPPSAYYNHAQPPRLHSEGALLQYQQPPPGYYNHTQHPPMAHHNHVELHKQHNSFLQNHHERIRAHDNLAPISPYPELKNLTGPLHLARHADPNHHTNPTSGQLEHTTSYYHFENRKQVGLPEFPFHHWKEDPHEHEFRPTYEQLLYAQYEEKKQLGLLAPRYRDDLGLSNNVSELDAVENARLHGTLQSIAGDVHTRPVSYQQLTGSINQLLDTYRIETDRRRNVYQQYLAERGPNDPETAQAHEVLLVAEAMTSGAFTVLQRVQSAPPDDFQQQMSSMAATVQHFGEHYQETEARVTQARSMFGEHDERTRQAKIASFQAEQQWIGARAAQTASTEVNAQALETPAAVAERERMGAEAYRAEADQLRAEVDKLEKRYNDPKDPRVALAKEQLKEAEAKAKDAEERAKRAQAVAEGRPVPALKTTSRKGSKSNEYCVVQ
jgi:hypothetical protein